MLTSNQIIAKSQSVVAATINSLIWFIPTASIQNVFVTSFGENQFIITVVYNLAGGLRAFTYISNTGLKTTMVYKVSRAIPLKLGLKAVMAYLYNEIFKYTPLLGWKTSMAKHITVGRSLLPLIGQKAFMKAKQKPTRMRPMIGIQVVPTKKKNGSTISPF
jgi:hypothetical protein